MRSVPYGGPSGQPLFGIDGSIKDVGRAMEEWEAQRKQEREEARKRKHLSLDQTAHHVDP